MDSKAAARRYQESSKIVNELYHPLQMAAYERLQQLCKQCHAAAWRPAFKAKLKELERPGDNRMQTSQNRSCAKLAANEACAAALKPVQRAWQEEYDKLDAARKKDIEEVLAEYRHELEPREQRYNATCVQIEP